jgi:hypothetical protein
MRGRAIVAVVITAVTLLATGCGGGGDNGSTMTNAASAPTTVGSAATTQAPEGQPQNSKSAPTGEGEAAGGKSSKAPKAPATAQPGSAKGTKANITEEIIKKLTQGTGGAKDNSKSRHFMEGLLAKARKEGIRVIGSAGGSEGESGGKSEGKSVGGIEQILKQLGSEAP